MQSLNIGNVALLFKCSYKSQSLKAKRRVINKFMADNMSVQDYVGMQSMMRDNSHAWGKGAGIWAIVLVIIVAFFVYSWHNNCNEKVLFATNLAKLDGRIDALEPTVTAHGNNLYSLNSVVSASVQGSKDLKENVLNQLYELNDEIFYNPGRRNRCSSNGCGSGREFKQSQTYNLASTTVTVDDTCRSC